MNRIFLLITAFALILSACGPVTPKAAATPPAPAISPPTAAAPTAKPQALAGSPGLEPITSENLNRLKQVDRWGQGTVSDVALSPDASMIAVGTSTGVYLYDSNTLERLPFDFIKALNNEILYEGLSEYPVRSVAFLPGSAHILALAGEQSVWWWNLDTTKFEGTILNNIPGFDISTIRLSPDGKTLLIVSGGGSAPCDGAAGNFALYRIETQTMLFNQYFCADPALQHSYNLAANGKAFLFDEVFDKSTITWSHRVTAVDMSTGAVLKTHLFDDRGPSFATPDGSSLGFYEHQDSTTATTTVFRDADTLQEMRSLDGEVVLMAPSGKMLLLRAGRLEWQDKTGESICGFDPGGDPSPFILSPGLDDRKMLQWSDWTEQVSVWDASNCTISSKLSLESLVLPPMFSSDGSLVLGGSDQHANVWDVKTGDLLLSRPTDDEARLVAAALSPDGTTLLVVTDGEPNVLTAFDLPGGKEKFHVSLDADNFHSVTISPDSTSMAILDSNGLSFRDMKSGKLVYQTAAYQYMGLAQLSFSPDGSTLALALNKREGDELNFIDVRTKKLIRTMPVEDSGVVFSPDWRYFAVPGREAAITIWDRERSEEKLELVGNHQVDNEYRYIDDLLFSPDGKLLVSLGGNVVRFWDVETGRLIAELAPSFSIFRVVFSPDGRLMVTTGPDGVIRFWGVPEGSK